MSADSEAASGHSDEWPSEEHLPSPRVGKRRQVTEKSERRPEGLDTRWHPVGLAIRNEPGLAGHTTCHII
jgi:hypothetical protein